MRRFRLALAWCLGVLALVLLGATGVVLWVILQNGSSDDSPPLMQLLLVLAAPLGLSFLFGLAWWKVLRRREHKWAMVASVVAVALAVSLLATHRHEISLVMWVQAAVGAAGIVAFAREESAAETGAKTSRATAVKSKPIPGDGTNKLLNNTVWIAGAAGTWVATTIWEQWARRHGLPMQTPDWFWLQMALCIAVVMIAHEAGHAVIGMVLRMKLLRVVLGPFCWWVADGKWKFQFQRIGEFLLLGGVLLAPIDLKDFRLRKILQVAAGPAVSIGTGLLASAVLLVTHGWTFGSEWRVLALFAAISTAVGLCNLVPFGINDGYSDGAKLYQLAKGGLWADYQEILAVVYSIAQTPLRFRDLNIDAVEQVAGTIALGMDELWMHLSAYSYYFDCGRLAESAAAVARAEQYCSQAGFEPHLQWLEVLVFAAAFVRRDAVAARMWWERMEGHKDFQIKEDTHTTLCALRWSEGRLEEANEEWEKAHAFACKMPATGNGEWERNAVRLMREALDASMAEDLELFCAGVAAT